MSLPARKELGQHWLDDQNTLEAIADLADVQPEDTVLEVGPGHGSLTKEILQRGASVAAVELDTELANTLVTKVKPQQSKLTVTNVSILDFNLTNLPSGYKVVANIPYYLTSNLIRVLCESANPPASITLLVQKEVAERICAAPGQMSLLSISAQVYYSCNLGPVVEAAKFSPPPKVDSQVVNMLIRPQPLMADVDNRLFFRIVKAGFANRRKTLQNSLSAGLQLSKADAAKVLQDCQVDGNARAQELSVDQWLNLTQYLTR